MRIEKVKIENFKSLKNADITLGNLTLITGVNSSGKSSFIQTLLFLKQNQNIADKKELIFEGKYINIDNVKSYIYQEAKNENVNISIFAREFNFKVSFPDNLNNSEDEKYSNDFNLFFDGFQYISTDRVPPQNSYNMSSNIEDNLIGFKGEFTAHYLNRNKNNKIGIPKLKHSEAKTNRLIENVSLWLNEISNGIEISTKIYPELNKVSLGYAYRYTKGRTDNYTPLNVGFGVTYILPIIVAILKAKDGDLLIIENPESDLHPSAQSKIAELCAIASANGVQIIVETHSDHFLNGVRVAIKKGVLKPEDSQIYYFRKDEGELETKIDKINIDIDGGIDKWSKGFFDEYRNKLDELLW